MTSTQIGDIAKALGFITEQQLEQCLVVQRQYRARGSDVKLLEVIRLQGFIDDKQMQTLLATQERMIKRQGRATPKAGVNITPFTGSLQKRTQPTRKITPQTGLFFGSKPTTKSAIENAKYAELLSLKQRFEAHPTAVLALAIGKLSLDLSVPTEEAVQWLQTAIKMDPDARALLLAFLGKTTMYELQL